LKEFFDVRTPEERAKASIPGTRLMTAEEAERIGALPKDTPLAFHCHHGGRSQAAAEHFAGLGYTNVSNVVGGIDAWSLEVASEIPRWQPAQTCWVHSLCTHWQPAQTCWVHSLCTHWRGPS